MIRFFFCFNQVSYILAYEATIKLSNYYSYIIIMPNRVRAYTNPQVKSLKYNPLIAVVLLFLSTVFSGVEIVLPHAKGGRLTRWMAYFSKNLSFIDDGMDTFRDQPKNLELEFLRHGSKYYSFNYPVPVSHWLKDLDIVGVCEISKLLKDEKPTLDLKDYDCLVIESPGVDLSNDFSKQGRVFFIRHPSYIKNQPIDKNIEFESGLQCSVEKTILGFNGEFILGETMVLIFALLCYPDKSKIHVYLDRSSFDNLTCLHEVFSDCGSINVNTMRPLQNPTKP